MGYVFASRGSHVFFKTKVIILLVNVFQQTSPQPIQIRERQLFLQADPNAAFYSQENLTAKIER